MIPKPTSKIFVLDTSVLLFDHNALTNFQENNVVIPITVLEELDNFKLGNETKNFEARTIIPINNRDNGFLSETSSKLKLHIWKNRAMDSLTLKTLPDLQIEKTVFVRTCQIGKSGTLSIG